MNDVPMTPSPFPDMPSARLQICCCHTIALPVSQRVALGEDELCEPIVTLENLVFWREEIPGRAGRGGEGSQEK